MSRIRQFLFLLLLIVPFISQAQTIELIGTSDAFILDNLKEYNSVEEVNLEHEEYSVLVFREKETEVTFYFTFYRGEKVCNYIKKRAPLADLSSEIAKIKASLTKIGDSRWENAEKCYQVDITESDGIGLILVKSLR